LERIMGKMTMLATTAVLVTLLGGAYATEVEAKAVPQIGKAKQVMVGLFDRLAAQTAQK
jgi:Mg2+ and Co2+ transporter CorA